MSQVTMATLEVRGQMLWLLPQRAVFLPESDTLIVADAEVGATEESLSVLSELVRRLEARRIIFLGDFLRAAHTDPAVMAAVQRWRELHGSIELTLVRSHLAVRSRLAVPVVEPPVTLDIQSFDEPLMHRGLALCHRPRRMAGSFVLAGHMFPCVNIGGRSHGGHRVPCYWFSPRLGVLPAFGNVTGMQAIRPAKGERVFASAADRVFELLPRQKKPPGTSLELPGARG